MTERTKFRFPRRMRKAGQREARLAFERRMVQNEPDPQRWPEDLRNILTGIADAMAGRPLTPDLILSLEASGRLTHVLPEHRVVVSYRAKDEATSGGKPVYDISVKGSRLHGGWYYSPGQLARALDRCRRGPDMLPA